MKEKAGDSPEWLVHSFTEYHGINLENEYPDTSEELDSPFTDNDTTPAGRASSDHFNSDSEQMKLQHSSASPCAEVVSYVHENDNGRFRSTSRGNFTQSRELESVVAHNEDQSDQQDLEESESESRFAWLGPTEFKELFQVDLNIFKETLNAYE
jgi:hypothetical protein